MSKQANKSRSRIAREYAKELLKDNKTHKTKEISKYIYRRWQEDGNTEHMTDGCISRALMDLVDITKECGDIQYIRVKDGEYRQCLADELNNKTSNAIEKIKLDTIKKLERELKKLNKKNIDELTSDEFQNVQDIKKIITFLKDKNL